MNCRYIVVVVAAGLATTAIAHEGVKNPAVMARMDGMTKIADNMKVIGNMAKGRTQFDVEAVRWALASVAAQAAETPALFDAMELDPKSDALPAIWDDFDDFTAKAKELETVANEVSASIEKPEDLRAALFLLGETCKSCHQTYTK